MMGGSRGEGEDGSGDGSRRRDGSGDGAKRRWQ